MRIEKIGSPASTASVTSGASGALDTARSRRNRLPALVRAHQDLVAAQWQLTQAGGPADPRIERDLAAVAECISGVLSNREDGRPEIEPPTRAGDGESSDSPKETS
jgi:hypothetical protein